jgi:hypothetical protein
MMGVPEVGTSPGLERRLATWHSAAAVVAGGARLPVLAALSGQWHAAVDAGHGREDVSAPRLALGGNQ